MILRYGEQWLFITGQSSNLRAPGLKTCPNFKGNTCYQVKLATKCLVSSSLVVIF